MVKYLIYKYIFLLSFVISIHPCIGQTLLKDIWPGTNSGFPYYLTATENILFFRAGNSTAGQELWKSDGTANGTVMLKDIYSGTSNSNPTELIELNGMVLFAADHPTYGVELWISDGTATGTVLLKDIWTGGNFTDGSPNAFARLGNNVIFSAQISSFQWEPMISDGTPSGTKILKDIYAGTAGSLDGLFNRFYEHNGELYFTAVSANHGSELWKTDGTTNGTTLVKDLNPGTNYGTFKEDEMVSFNGHLYFIADDGSGIGKELWRTDGTANSTSLVKDINPGSGDSEISDFEVLGNKLYFTANNGSAGRELWGSDGTNIGTTLIKDIYPGSGHGFPTHITRLKDKLYFSAEGLNTSRELWVSDGTTIGTKLFFDFYQTGSADVNDFYVYADLLYLSANNPTTTGRETWIVNGDSTATKILADINPGTASSYSTYFTPFMEKLFFSATTGPEGTELWSYDPCTGSGLSASVISMSDSLISLANASSFQWYYCSSNSSLKMEGETDSIFIAQLSGNYQVEVMGNGCIRRSNCIYVENKPDIYLSNDTFSTNSLNNASYQWYDCDSKQIISGATSLTYKALTSGNYAVIVSLNGISDTSDCLEYELLPNGINQLSQTKYSVYPNPAENFVVIKMSSFIESKKAHIVDLQGKKILEIYLNSKETIIDLSELNPGMYLMEIEGEKFQKIIIQ